MESCSCASGVACQNIAKIELSDTIPSVIEVDLVHLLVPLPVALGLLVRPKAFLIEILIRSALG